MPTVSANRLDFLVDNEANLIGFMSGVLQISEYELFRIAHNCWFDYEIGEKRLESLFIEYLSTGNAPYWVNDFARKAHEKFKAGKLDYKEYGIKRRVIDRRTKITGLVIIAALLVLMLVYSYLVSSYVPY
jgi:hypothetical protein